MRIADRKVIWRRQPMGGIRRRDGTTCRVKFNGWKHGFYKTWNPATAGRRG
jgi:hypothetical protein